MKTIRILDLFAGTQSVRKSLDQMYDIDIHTFDPDDGITKGRVYNFDDELLGSDIIYEYIGVDIYSPEQNNLIFDLTQDNIVEKLKDKLPNDWTPDFIWASPVCNKFSTACAYRGGNLFFEKTDNENIKVRTKWEDKETKSYPYEKCKLNKDRYKQEAELALKMHNNTKAIIDYFEVPFAIENPRRAMSKYLYKDYVNNFTSYCMYGYQYEKPTTIYSNVELKLNICNHKPKRKFHTIMLSGSKKDYIDGRKNMSNYAQRSSVPPRLIQSIITQLIKGGIK